VNHASNGPADASMTTVGWVGDAATGVLRMIDQTLLPTEFVEIDCADVPTVWEAIKSLRVRGAPAIGVAAAFGTVIGARAEWHSDFCKRFRSRGL
jgi:methylthioribose-1-phosphate isomerase